MISSISRFIKVQNSNESNNNNNLNNNNNFNFNNNNQNFNNDNNSTNLMSTSPFEFLLLSNNNSTSSSFNQEQNNFSTSANLYNQSNNYFSEIVDISDASSDSDISSLGSNDFLEISDTEIEVKSYISSINQLNILNNGIGKNNIINSNFYNEKEAVPDDLADHLDESENREYLNGSIANQLDSNCFSINSNVLLKELCNLPLPPPLINSPTSEQCGDVIEADDYDDSDSCRLNNLNNNYSKIEKEKQIYQAYLNMSYRVGDTMFLIDYNWLNEWLLYQEASEQKKSAYLIGPIDNNSLLLNPEFIKPDLTEGTHYAIVSEPLWNYFLMTYGGGPEIPRKVIKSYMTDANVDLKIPIPLHFIKSSIPDQSVVIYTHKNELISSLKDRACFTMGIQSSDVRIWDYYNQFKHCELKSKLLVNDTNLLSNQYILLEEKLEDGAYPPYRI